ncbi:MAG: hypothetical protein ACK4KU_14515 [Acinetobacter sp.]|uniref:hypothetical protein n=1 Tax=Acinetobacter sp. TaxID=472 RepID=UPI00391C6BCA
MEVKGLKELEANLLALSKEYGAKSGVQALRPAVRAAVGPIEQTIKANTPRDSGGLAESTKTRIGKPTRSMLMSDHFHKDQILVARVGWVWSGKSLWAQSLKVEFGSRDSSGTATLRQAFDAHRDQMIKDFVEVLGPAIEKKAKQLNKKRNK